ncbi:sugar phosphate isomerase/epimerase family protein [Mangrovihabitans endophyticus]|uniref:Xylose isomerase n=1 Tax=Mangrovihabitans endophyticus TaxID=1751298 RepID=A0A8J3FNH5_9ACTN|nr:sugar phosphate isomerase/epimerase [Mangrovihabitans endophyticus]GGK81671.1 xylose isomerase [Mangrovihabitans endophyticus]
MPLKSLSLQLYSVRHELDKDVPGTLARIADIGYRQVECSHKLYRNTPGLAGMLHDAGLIVPTFTSPLTDVNVADTGPIDHDAVFAAAVEVGAGTVVDTFIPEQFWSSPDDVARIAEGLNRAAVTANGYGLRVGYHNHWWELERRWNGSTALELLVDALRPEVVMEIDAYWVAVGGEDVLALLDRLGERVRFLHLKDGPISRNNLEQQPAGKGSLPIAEIIEATPQVEAGAVEFDAYAGDIFEGIAAAYAYLQPRTAS